MKIPACGLELKELKRSFVDLGLKPYRAKQFLRWTYKSCKTMPEEMTDISVKDREKILDNFSVITTTILNKHKSRDGTIKFLIKLADQETVETVLIPDRNRLTVCISTQVGCPVQCAFCASGSKGLIRNLSTHEIIEQILHVKMFLESDKRITNVVLMGIGEPLLNYQNIVKALKIMKAKWGLAVGYNKITLSTIGRVDKIYSLINDKITPNLAISLHAPFDKLRCELIPKFKWGISDLLDAAMEYRKKCKKDVTIEYVLISNINDQQRHAIELAKKLKNTGIKVNLIPYNCVDGLPYNKPDQVDVDRFTRILRSSNIFVTVRKSRGNDINAACGQLRAERIK